MKKSVIVLLLLGFLNTVFAAPQINVDQADALKIGKRIWQNEAQRLPGWIKRVKTYQRDE